VSAFNTDLPPQGGVCFFLVLVLFRALARRPFPAGRVARRGLSVSIRCF